MLLIACLIHINILLANSLDFDDHDLDKETERIALPKLDMSYVISTKEGCKYVPMKASTDVLAKQGPWEVMKKEAMSPHSRTKRRMFLPDNRLRLREQSVGRFPFNSAVAIRINGEVKCSGIALLRPRFYLTAAHCVQPDGIQKEIEVGVLHQYRAMQWARVNDTRVHPIWSRQRVAMKKLRLKDYAVLETTTLLPVTPMGIGYVGHNAKVQLQNNKTFMYFSAFDDEKRPDDLNMRFCKMLKIKYYRIFSRCDTVPKTAGAGVYVRMRNKETGKVERKVIAIATGDYGVKADQEYSVALRITSRMYPHICYFVTGSYNGCN